MQVLLVRNQLFSITTGIYSSINENSLISLNRCVIYNIWAIIQDMDMCKLRSDYYMI